MRMTPSGLVIWKYEILASNCVTIEMQVGAKILSVGVQTPRKICLWATVDPRAPREERTFFVIGTGEPMWREAKEFVGTAFDGPFVWHVFQEQQ